MTTNYTATTTTDGFATTQVYDSNSGTSIPVAAGTVSTDTNHNSQKYAPMQVQLAAGSAVSGTVVIEAVSGTALAADATNSELRVSTYVKTTAAGDTALTLGQSTKAGSLPVTIASDQGNVNVVIATGSNTVGNVGVVAGSALIGGVNLVDSAGTNKVGVDASHVLLVSDGGTATVQITASSAGAVKAAAGRLCRVLVSTTVTSAVTIYDNTNAASGTALLTIPASTTIGTIYSPQMPAAVGIYVGGGTGSPQITVSYA